MATKPITLPQLWAADVLYTNGPFVGSIMKVNPGAPIAAQGHRPGAADPTAAEHENYQQFWIDTWLREWVYLGTYHPDPDAHIVETDATGRAGLHGLTVNDTVDEIAVLISGVNTFVPTILASCSTGANVFESQIGASSGTCYSAVMSAGTANAVGFYTGVGTLGKGIEVDMTGTTFAGGGKGIYVEANGATSAHGINVFHQGINALDTSGLKVTAQGGVFGVSVAGESRCFMASGLGANSIAFLGTTLNSNQACAQFYSTSSPNTNAVEATAGAGGHALEATSTTDHAILASATTGDGIRASTTDGTAGYFTSTNFYGILAKSSEFHAARFEGKVANPVRAACYFVPQGPRPTDTIDGQLGWIGPESQFVHSNSADATGWRGMWSSTGGYCMARGTLTTKFLNAGAGVWSDVITITASNGNAPKVVGQQVLIRISCDVSSSLATNNILNVRVLDDSNGGNIVFTRSNATGYTNVYTIGGIRERSVSIAFLATCTVAGTQVYRLQMGTNTAASNLTAHDTSFDFLGQD